MWYLIIVLIWIFLMVNDIEHLFVYLLAICISSLEKYLLRSSAHFKINFFFANELYEFFIYIYIHFFLFDICPLWAIWFTNIFSHFCIFVLLMVSFAVQKFLVWGSLTCSFFVFVASSFGVRFKKSLPRPMSGRLLPMFSSGSLWFQLLRTSIYSI